MLVTESLSNNTNPAPFDMQVTINGNTLIPGEVIKPNRLHRALGRIGSSEVVESYPNRVRMQRKSYVNDVIESIGNEPVEVSLLPKIGEQEVYGQDYEDIGYSPETYSVSELQDTFFPENDPKLVGRVNRLGWYRVVSDINNNPTFLKTVNRDPGNNKGIAGLSLASSALGEVFASRVAARVGYPVPETKPVLHDGMPWLASPYIVERDDSYINNVDYINKTSTEITNPSALRTRYIFNALIGAKGDNNQGIIDTDTGTYSAQDISLDFDMQELHMSGDALKGRIKKNFGIMPGQVGNSQYGVLNGLNIEDKEYALGLLSSAEQLDRLAGEQIFAYGKVNYKDAVVCVEHLKNRARVLKQLVSEGVFDQPH